MQVNYNTATPRTSPAFGTIRYDAAKDTINTVLNLDKAKEFRKLVDAHAEKEIGHVVLFGEGKKLSANVFAEINDGKIHVAGNMKRYKQRLFESPLSFVKRMCKNADNKAQKTLEEFRKRKLLDGDI